MYSEEVNHQCGAPVMYLHFYIQTTAGFDAKNGVLFRLSIPAHCRALLMSFHLFHCGLNSIIMV